jgi:hypothetical protein
MVVIGGAAGRRVQESFLSWRQHQATARISELSSALRANAGSHSILYYSEWIDSWLMGDRLPGPGAVETGRFSATCLSRSEAIAWAKRIVGQFVEQRWLIARLREAAESGAFFASDAAVVIIREVLGASVRDEEIAEAMLIVPEWLTRVTETS